MTHRIFHLRNPPPVLRSDAHDFQRSRSGGNRWKRLLLKDSRSSPLSTHRNALTAIEHYVDFESDSQADGMWTRWLRDVTSKLAAATQVTISAYDWSVVASYVVALKDQFSDGVAIVVVHSAPLDHGSLVLHRLGKSRHPEDNAEACRDLVFHLLARFNEPQWMAHALGPIVRRLRRRLDPDDVRELVSQAIAVSIPGAAAWLDPSQDPSLKVDGQGVRIELSRTCATGGTCRGFPERMRVVQHGRPRNV